MKIKPATYRAKDLKCHNVYINQCVLEIQPTHLQSKPLYIQYMMQYMIQCLIQDIDLKSMHSWEKRFFLKPPFFWRSHRF